MKKSLLTTFILICFNFHFFAQNNLKSLADKADQAIFTISALDENGNEIDKGCGFFIDEKGVAVGRAHVFKNAVKAKAILDDGRQFDITKVISIDYISNTALFNVNSSGIEFIYFSNEYVSPFDNEEVFVLKNVVNKGSKIDLGKIKNVVKIDGFGELSVIEQEIKNGNDGSPVINRKGQVIGIASQADGSDINFSINYNGLALNQQNAVIDFGNTKSLLGDQKLKFPPFKNFTPIYISILRGDYNQALTLLNNVSIDSSKTLKNDKDRRAILYLRAHVEKSLRRFDEALNSYTEILEIKLDDGPAFLERAKIKIKMGDLEGAGYDLEESLGSKGGDQASIKKIQGDLYEKLDDPIKADNLYKEAQAMGYDHFDIYRDRSKLYTKQGSYEEAKKYIDLAIEKNPFESELYLLRGEINAQMGKIKEATADFDQSSSLGNPNLAGLKIIARAKLEMEDNEGAIKSLEQAYSYDKEDVDILLLRGKSFNRIRSYEEALMNLDKLLKLDPFNAKAYYERGKANLALNRTTDALQDFTKAVQLDPDYTGAYLDRGVAFGLYGKFPQAIQDFKNVVALDPKNAQGYYNLGLAEFQIKNRPAACRAWTEAKNLGYEDAEDRVEEYCSPKNFSQGR